jgi:hypothetical protein
MTKKTKKVKKKMVQSKASSKKKKVNKVIKKKKRRAKIAMDNIYTILNKVQLSRKPAVFTVENEDVDVIENIIKDIKLPYRLNRMKTQAIFDVKPGEEKDEYELIDVEYLEDELCPEDEIDFKMGS